MAQRRHKAKCNQKIVIAIAVIGFLSILVILFKLNAKCPIYSDWANKESVVIEYEYLDYLGYTHSGAIADETTIKEFGEIMRQIQDENPPRVRLMEERCGARSYQLIVSCEKREILYFIQGDYLIVGKNNRFKSHTIYQLSGTRSEQLIGYLVGLIG